MNENLIINNEKQFADWFKVNYREFGFSKLLRGDISRCPDFIAIRDNKEVGVELETIASNFVLHKHDIGKVDEIICIVKDIELGKPISVAKNLKFEGPRKITLSIDDKVYERFQKYCDERDIMLSKRIERIMKNIMEDKK